MALVQFQGADRSAAEAGEGHGGEAATVTPALPPIRAQPPAGTILSAMSSRARVAMALLGALLIVLAIAALAYSLSPVATAHDYARPAATLFVPPPEDTRSP